MVEWCFCFQTRFKYCTQIHTLVFRWTPNETTLYMRFAQFKYSKCHILCSFSACTHEVKQRVKFIHTLNLQKRITIIYIYVRVTYSANAKRDHEKGKEEIKCCCFSLPFIFVCMCEMHALCVRFAFSTDAFPTNTLAFVCVNLFFLSIWLGCTDFL